MDSKCSFNTGALCNQNNLIRLTQDFVFQKHPSLPFKDMLKLDLPNCGLKHVDLSPVSAFSNLSR